MLQKNGCGIWIVSGAAAKLHSGGKNMKNKKTLLMVLAVVLVIGAMAWLWLGNQKETVQGGKSITVTVVHSDGSSKEFAYSTDAEYLGPVILGEGLVEGENGAYGLEIHTVDGEKASWEESQSYWALYEGEEYAMTGADGVVLTDGGVYKLVYTIG